MVHAGGHVEDRGDQRVHQERRLGAVHEGRRQGQLERRAGVAQAAADPAPAGVDADHGADPHAASAGGAELESGRVCAGRGRAELGARVEAQHQVAAAGRDLGQQVGELDTLGTHRVDLGQPAGPRALDPQGADLGRFRAGAGRGQGARSAAQAGELEPQRQAARGAAAQAGGELHAERVEARPVGRATGPQFAVHPLQGAELLRGSGGDGIGAARLGGRRAGEQEQDEREAKRDGGHRVAGWGLRAGPGDEVGRAWAASSPSDARDRRYPTDGLRPGSKSSSGQCKIPCPEGTLRSLITSAYALCVADGSPLRA